MLKHLLIGALLVAVFTGCKGCNKDGGPDLENVVAFEDLVLEVCDNDEDDNEDGLVDCADPACQVRDVCLFEPPDPASLAPPSEGAASFADSIRFLWEGDNPVVRGVDPAALDLGRVAVVRTQLLDRDGNPAVGVGARIAGRPELGYTFSRADGMVDLVANGGEPVHVRVGGGDFLTVDRPVEPERLAYGWAEDIVMTPLDARTTAVDFAAKRQVAAGSEMADDSGSRTARLYFPPGTDVIAHLPDGQRGRLDKASIRLTEYTVGDTGMSAMPAWLPDESAYTYAVELSVDEARAAGADQVRFSQPVYLYLDNFLDFEVGTTVPSGFYLRNAYRWDPSPNGVVMRKTADGVAVAGQSTADRATREALGLTNEELDVIADMFETGETFWRVPVEHFSPCDLNWPFEFPPDAVSPDDFDSIPSTREEDPCLEAGSRIECQNQVMSKSISLPGTPLDLVYRTDRVAGSGRRFVFPLTGDEVPASLQKVVITVDLAGRYWREDLEPAPNLEYEFEWDGLDAYGREVDGKWPIKVSVGYYYEVFYTEPPRSERAFASAGGEILEEGRRIMPIWRRYRDLFGSFDALGAHKLGGWSFDSLHAYDSTRQVLYPGGAPEVRSSTTGNMVRLLERFADTQGLPFDPKTSVAGEIDVAVGPDDSLYMLLRGLAGTSAIIRRHVDGRLEHLAGQLLTYEEYQAAGCVPTCGMDGPATEAIFGGFDLTLDREGTPYFSQGGCVYAVRDNALQLLDDCRNYERPEGSDDLPASLDSFVVTDAGDLIMAGGERILRIRRGSRFVERLAGCSQRECSRAAIAPADGRTVDIRPEHLTIAPNGDIYFADWFDGSVAALDSAGRVRVVAPGEDDMELRALRFGRDGRLYAYVLREIALNLSVLNGGSWQALGGVDPREVDPLSLVWAGLIDEGEPVPASSTILLPFGTIAANSRGRVYFGTLAKNPVPDAEPEVVPALMELGSAFPDSIVSDGEVLIPSREGGLLHRFDTQGRHLATLDSVTSTPLLEFERDEMGRVVAVVDASGNRTVVERDGENLRAIEGPWGHRVEFDTDASGYITAIRMPDGASASAELGYEGLIESWTDPRGDVSRYEYDSVGRLTRAEDPAGGFKILRRMSSGTVELETASGRQVSYGGYDGITRESVLIDPAGLEWRTRRFFNTWTERTHPDGTMTRLVMRSDPRFGALAQYVGERTVTLPSGLEHTQTRRLTYETADVNDLTSLLTLQETIVNAGREWRHDYDAPSRTLTTTSPLGRRVVRAFDDQMRIVSEQVGSFAPAEYTYDVSGALTEIRHADEVASLGYTRGFLTSVSLPGRNVTMTRDEMGRIASLDDGVGRHTVTRDQRGAPVVTEVAGGFDYTRTYTAVGRAQTVTMPDGAEFAYDWDLDRRLQASRSPSGEEVTYQRDATGRLLAIETPQGRQTREYDPTTGQLSAATSPGVSLELAYDGMLVTTRDYDIEGVRVNITRRLGDTFAVNRQSVDGQHVTFTRDDDGMLTEAGPVSLSYLDDAPAIQTVQVGSVVTTYTYDERGAMVGAAHVGPAGELFAEDVLATDGRASQIDERVTGASTTDTFAYDAAGRLVSVSRDGMGLSAYAYDAAGHRTSIDGTAVSLDSGGRVAAVGATAYTWDADGRLAGIDDGAPRTFEYDALGQLARATAGGQTIEYRYGPRGHRVARLVDGTLDRVWVYDDENRPVAELDGAGDVLGRFVYASTPIVPDAMLKDGRTYRLIRDRRHSVRLVVDAANGQVMQQLEYDPMGRITLDTNPGFQPFGFAGGTWDPATGLFSMGRRDYDPVSGIWTSPDPRGFADASTHLYQYAAGDPINIIDPDGETLFVIGWALAAAAAAGAAVAVWNHEVGLVRESGTKARERYWGLGGTAGPQNQLRHCTGQCDAVRNRGVLYAEMAGAYHEIPSDLLPGAGGSDNTPDDPGKGVDRAADLIANACGRELAQEGDPSKDCVDLCQEAINSGRLPVPHHSHWQNDMGAKDVAMRRKLGIGAQPGAF